mmetsp:Transcript_24566/g.97482  ORF Transcript_24566/g.97482 Transcript_24566/m.97482 type:complete len:168 (-) Transcript_24566:1382-1885(-)
MLPRSAGVVRVVDVCRHPFPPARRRICVSVLVIAATRVPTRCRHRAPPRPAHVCDISPEIREPWVLPSASPVQPASLAPLPSSHVGCLHLQVSISPCASSESVLGENQADVCVGDERRRRFNNKNGGQTTSGGRQHSSGGLLLVKGGAPTSKATKERNEYPGAAVEA